MYQPQAGYSGFITTLRLTININSIEEANFPYIPDDTPPDVLQAILDKVAINTPFKEIILYVKKGNGGWVERAPIRIFNKEPYYDINLMRFFSDSNTIDVAEDLSLGIQIKIGNVLTAADTILVWGSVVAEKKNNGNEELADRISALETLLSTFGAPSASLPGTNGLVPAPPAGGGEFLLRGDRSWENPSKFATSAQITTQINNLIGNSSTALDTLQELGAALANDANFATTITNALSGKAPITSPDLMGIPTAPTANYGTNTSQVATTAFVQAVVAALTETRTLTLNGALNIAANTWFTIGRFVGIGLPSEAALYAISIHIQYGDGTNTYGHWQYSGGTLISSVQWKAGGVQLATTFKMEAHNGNDFNCTVQFDRSNVNRSLQVLFDIPIITQAPTTLTAKLRRIIPS